MFRQIFDNIHLWLFHLFDTGMLTKSNVINVDDGSVDENIEKPQDEDE